LAAGTSSQIKRNFERASDATTFYSDYVSLAVTEHEVIVQFYETEPGLVGADGQPGPAPTRLRATVIMSPAQATNVRKILERGERTNVAGPANR
jgi:hypothetical protein